MSKASCTLKAAILPPPAQEMCALSIAAFSVCPASPTFHFANVGYDVCQFCRCASEVEAGRLAEDDAELSAGLRCLTAWQDDHTAVDSLLERLRVDFEEGYHAGDAEVATQAGPRFSPFHTGLVVGVSVACMM